LSTAAGCRQWLAAVVHNETSTGVTSNIAAVRRVIDRAGHPALFLVDTTSSLGSIDYRHDEWGVEPMHEGKTPGRKSIVIINEFAAQPLARVQLDFHSWRPIFVTYIPMARGFVYLAVLLDWATRPVLSWRLSITIEAAFCVETLEDALARHGRPDIFNTDQGSQFTSSAFTGVLASNAIAISMDGKGAWRDNVFVQRLWRSVKYEQVYLRAYETVSEARSSIGCYLDFYNRRRPHSSHDGSTPDQAYFNSLPLRLAA
jgi:transposase InsO family protein